MTVQIDPAAMSAAARALEGSARAVAAAAEAVGGCEFHGSQAGRDYAAQGRQVHAGVQRIATRLTSWSKASAACGRALSDDLDGFVAADAQNSARLGGR